MTTPLVTNFTEGGEDIGTTLAKLGVIQKNYLLDVYPSLVDWHKAPSLWNWGHNNVGQLGDNTIANKSSPVQTIAGGTNWNRISTGDGYTAAIKTDGTLWTWGLNNYGRLGDNTIANKSSPVQTVSGGTNWKSIAGGEFHTVAIKTDGTFWTWGSNNYGVLGDTTQTDRSSPIQTVAGGTNWKSVSAGRFHTVAIKTDGTLWAWGHGDFGQLGDNTIAHKSSPVQTVSGGTNWKSVSGDRFNTLAFKTDGTLWTWGRNNFGQLGDNTITNRSSPVQTIAGGTNWKSIAGGSEHTIAIKTDSTLWTWGRNNDGQLGDNTVAHNSSPVQTVAGGTNWKSVASGGPYTAAIKTDGTLWSWGANNYGQLGDNTIANKSSPVQTVSGGTNWKSVSGGWAVITAIQEGDGW